MSPSVNFCSIHSIKGLQQDSNSCSQFHVLLVKAFCITQVVFLIQGKDIIRLPSESPPRLSIALGKAQTP